MSVWIQKKALGLTGFLFAILMYAFSLLAYYSLSEDFNEGYCESTLKCFLTTLDKTFKADVEF